MMLRFFALAVFAVSAATSWAQELPLWRLTNTQEPQTLPAYQPGISPFGLSVPAEVLSAAPVLAEEDLTKQENDRKIERARQMVANANVLRPRFLSPAKALTDGPHGVRVLVQGVWVGQGDALPVRYDFDQDIRALLQEIRVFDSDTAHALARTLENRQREAEAQPTVVQNIDKKGNKIILKGKGEEIILPLNVAE